MEKGALQESTKKSFKGMIHCLLNLVFFSATYPWPPASHTG